MATRADVAAFSRAQNAVVDAAKQRLSAVWASLGEAVWDAATVRQVLADVFPALVADYGDAAAALAAEWFEQQVALDAELADPVGADESLQGAYSTLGPLFDGRALAVLAGLGLVLDRMVKQAGRDTIRRSAFRAEIRWARVPMSAKPCAWCLKLASQGAVYRSEETASGREFHGGCNCVGVPVRDLSDLPRGYDPGALRSQYESARKAADSSGDSAVLAELRRQQGIS